MKYLWAAFAAASACAQEIASPLPPDQMIAPEDKIVLDSQAKEIFREWDKVAVPVGQSVVALVAVVAIALGLWVALKPQAAQGEKNHHRERSVRRRHTEQPTPFPPARNTCAARWSRRR